jgi:amino acid transporter
MYAILTLFVAAIFVIISAPVDLTSSPFEILILLFGIMTFTVLLMALITYSFFNTKYVIHDGILYSWSPFAIIKLELRNIKKVERTIIPIHVRVGASFYSGRFYIPSIGWTRAIITNMNDGVLITTKDNKHYLITPSDPDKFVKFLKKK